jgi:hypothetical protein
MVTTNADPNNMFVIEDAIKGLRTKNSDGICPGEVTSELIVERDKNVTRGQKNLLVHGIVKFTVDVEAISGEVDAKKIANTLELKLSPWAQINGEIDDQEIFIEEVEDVTV